MTDNDRPTSERLAREEAEDRMPPPLPLDPPPPVHREMTTGTIAMIVVAILVALVLIYWGANAFWATPPVVTDTAPAPAVETPATTPAPPAAPDAPTP